MAHRKRPKSPKVDLFPFLDLLTQVVGCICITMILMVVKIITGTKALAAPLVYGKGAERKVPAYIDCFPDKVNVYQSLLTDWPIQTTYTGGQALSPDGPLSQFLGRLHPQDQYVVLLVREGGQTLYRQVRAKLIQAGIDYAGGFPWEGDVDYEAELKRVVPDFEKKYRFKKE